MTFQFQPNSLFSTITLCLFTCFFYTSVKGDLCFLCVSYTEPCAWVNLLPPPPPVFNFNQSQIPGVAPGTRRTDCPGECMIHTDGNVIIRGCRNDTWPGRIVPCDNVTAHFGEVNMQEKCHCSGKECNKDRVIEYIPPIPPCPVEICGGGETANHCTALKSSLLTVLALLFASFGLGLAPSFRKPHQGVRNPQRVS